ncbi:MAG: T9SS type A sorting domain-containing protein, partial [Bacteroidota bacterium]
EGNALRIELKNPVRADCQYQQAQFDVAILGNSGQPPYRIRWAGPSAGQKNIDGTYVILNKLQHGIYHVSVSDAQGCTRTSSINLNCVCNSVAFEVKDPVAASCGQSDGKFDIVLRGNHPSFEIAWTGPVSGATQTDNRWYSIQNLTAGTYHITVSDDVGCTANDTFELVEEDCTGNLPDTNYTTFQTSPKVSIFPNPNSGTFSLVLPNGHIDHIYYLEIVGSNGQLLQPRQLHDATTTTVNLDLSAYQNGIYFVRLVHASSTSLHPVVLAK